MITIFAVPRAFEGQFDTNQRNAIRSWTLLQPRPEVILLGQEEGMVEAVKDLDVLHIPDLKKNEFGTPLINEAFKRIQAIAKNEILAYVNADIILTSNFMEAIKSLQDIKEKPFLAAGQRTNINLKEPISFIEKEWEKKMQERVKKEGRLYGPAGLDYWIFPRSLRFDCPPFAIGRFGFDSWLVYHLREQGIPVIDTTGVISAIHQNHDHPQERKSSYGAENQKTMKLMGGYSKLGTLRDADWILTDRGIKQTPFPKNMFVKLTLFYPWRLALALKRRIHGFRLS